MTAKEKEDVENLLKNFYLFLDKIVKNEPYDEATIDRILDNINLCRLLLKQ